MVKKAALFALAVAIGAAGLFGFAGRRIAFDGTAWPRLVSSEANYDALEADRARQRQQAAPAPSGAGPATSAPIALAAPGAGNSGSGSPPAPAEAASDIAEGAAPDKARPTSGPPPASWPDFRGRNRDGRYDETAIRTDWPREGLPPMWKQPIGLGYASFVAADGRAFTIEQRRLEEVVSAYDVATGRELWTHGWEGEFVEYQGGDGPRSTPTYHEGRLYALGALGELRCLDAETGALVWRRNILADNGASNLEWGMTASPLIVDDTVIVLAGGPRGKSVAAYNRLNGEAVWTSLDDPQAYTSPMLVTLAGVRQILIVSATRAAGLTVDEGRLLWEFPWVTHYGINVAQPLLLGNDRVFLSAGYGHGAAVFEVARTGDDFSTRTIWQNTRMKNKFTSSVLHQGYIYGLDEAILACVDAATGELKWKGGRYGYGQTLLAGDHLVVLTEDGDVALVRATPERHEEVARFPAIEGRTWNHPIIAGGYLIVRNLREMAAFDLR
jgi:outer membrane protein assembly factor BamB